MTSGPPPGPANLGSFYKRKKKSAADTMREQEPLPKQPILKRVDQLIALGSSTRLAFRKAVRESKTKGVH